MDGGQIVKYSYGTNYDKEIHICEYEELPIGPSGTDTVCIPKFTAENLPLVKEEVVRNRNKHLINRSIDEIIEFIDMISRKWLDRNYPLRKQD